MKLLLHKILSNWLIYLLLIFGLQSGVTIAQTTEEVNPLKVNFEDELLPKINRDLTKLEKEESKTKSLNWILWPNRNCQQEMMIWLLDYGIRPLI